MGGATPERIGLLGGSFDPPHEGHLWMARRARRWLDLDSVWFLPSVSPPHKDSDRLAPYAERVAMLSLLLEGEADFAVKELEREAGTRYSIDLVRSLAQRPGGTDGFYFIIGEDSLADMKSWREPAALFGEIRVVVLARAGAQADWELPCIFLTGEMHPAQSRVIRAALARGERAPWIPDSLADHIAKRGLYRGEDGP